MGQVTKGYAGGGGVTTAQKAVLDVLEYDGASLTVSADIDIDNNDLLNNTLSSGDGRSVITRTFNVTQAVIASKGAVTTNTFDWFTLADNEGILWMWMENAGAVSAGASVWLKCGKAGSLTSLFAQTDMSGAAAYYDDNAKHGSDLGTFGVMGNSGNNQDATVYFGTQNAIKVHVQTTGGNLGDLSSGGPWRVHALCVRVDDTQMTEAA